MSLNYKGESGYAFNTFMSKWLKDLFKSNIADHLIGLGWEEDYEGVVCKQIGDYTFGISAKSYLVNLECIDTKNNQYKSITFSVFADNGYVRHIEECERNLEKDIESGRFNTELIYCSFTPNEQYEDIKARMEAREQAQTLQEA